MTDHKATPEQWAADRYDWARADTEALDGNSAFRCILELRDRVEALEAAESQRQQEVELLKAALRQARQEVQAQESAPAVSLVELVASAISGCGNVGPIKWWTPEARAAILTVADWSEQQGLRTAADWLRQEVG